MLTRRSDRRARWSDERGAVAGIEVLPLAVLVFVVGTLVVANAWAVVDTKMAVTSAAREAVRAFVEAPSQAAAETQAAAAATEVMAVAGRATQLLPVEVEGELRRCAQVHATVRAMVPAVVVPWIGGLGSFTPSSTAAEIVDPLRSGVPGEASCVAP